MHIDRGLGYFTLAINLFQISASLGERRSPVKRKSLGVHSRSMSQEASRTDAALPHPAILKVNAGFDHNPTHSDYRFFVDLTAF